MSRPARAAVLFAAALSLAVVAACAKPAGTIEPVAAPNFTITDLQGSVHTLADYKGKVLVLNFWATWCPPCRREIPDFIAADKELRGEGLAILGVSVDELSAADLADWAKRMGMNYPVALATPKIVADFEPGEFIPATIIIDGKGLIRYRESGLMTKDALVRLFRQFKS
jgi:peroxiredoxin